MDWLQSLLWDPSFIAHIVFFYVFVVAAGVYLDKMKIFGVSLGVIFVLSVGILMGHSDFTIDTRILHFIRELGLVLFVSCTGLQVESSSFSPFKEEGMTLNLLAVSIATLNIVVTSGLYYLQNGRVEPPMMIGIPYGAVTNTPGLGAASETLNQLSYNGSQIALGYACVYPLGVVGIIGSITAIHYIFRVNAIKEGESLKTQSGDAHHEPHMTSLEVCNESISGKALIEIRGSLGRDFVHSCIHHEGRVSIPNHETIFNMGGQLFIVCSEEDTPTITIFIGKEVELDWERQDLPMVSRRILVTRPEINGKTLGSMHFRGMYSISATRVNRSGIDLSTDPNLILQVGNRVMIVGQQDAVERAVDVSGNQLKRLDTLSIVTIFMGIFLGILLESLPIAFPDMPTPSKLGLVNGPLVTAILVGRSGHKFHLATHTTISANLMLHEIDIVLLLVSVGTDTGINSVQTVAEGDGLLHADCGFLIAVILLLTVGVIARLYYKVSYFTLMGLVAGSNTDPPALAYTNQVASSDTPAVGYSTAYPLSMSLRILTGQVILLAMM